MWKDIAIVLIAGTMAVLCLSVFSDDIFVFIMGCAYLLLVSIMIIAGYGPRLLRRAYRSMLRLMNRIMGI